MGFFLETHQQQYVFRRRWLQSQNLWRIVNGMIPQPTVSPGSSPVTAQDIAVWDDKDEAAFGTISLKIAHHM